MVGPGASDDLFPLNAAGSLGGISDVENGLCKQGFVSLSSPFSEPFVSPSED